MEPNKVIETQDERGDWAYPSLAATGHVEVELPSLPGSPRPTEQLHARDFGGHVVSKIEASFAGNPYKSGPQQNPAQTLNHYIAVARGAKLVDNGSINRLETLARQLDKASDQREFFSRVVRPYLNSLKPQRRQR